MTYLATDLDGTFIPLNGNSNGDSASQRALQLFSRLHATSPLELVYVTGRHLASVLDAIEEHALPVPNWILADVGSSIFQRQQPSEEPHRFDVVQPYQQRLGQITAGAPLAQQRDWMLSQVGGLRLQEPFKQGPHKLSFYTDALRLDAVTQQLRSQIETRKLPYSVVASIDPFNGDGLVDVMPQGVSKAFAIAWWCEHRGVQPEQVVFAGDSGNDYEALVAGYRAILVANADRALAANVLAEHERRGLRGQLFLASQPSTAGVLEGARWFGLVADECASSGTVPAMADPATPDAMHPDPKTLDAIELHRALGAVPVSATATQFSVWAPRRERLEIKDATNERVYPLQALPSGYHVGRIEGLSVGDRYWVQIANGPARPDPVSRFQPEGVHGPSQIIDHRFAWTDTDWKGVRRDDLIVYELHIGAFTDEGTFLSAIPRLDELVELGVTAIEIMPPNETAGRWNWGYDGVNLFAPRHSYGTPNDFRRFVDAAHARGLAVIVDVVYNHFGPEGNYLRDFGSYISAKHNTAWGAAPNLDGARNTREMRRILVANAIHWLDDYHVDGLRVDAIHCIQDKSEPHWVSELSTAVRRWGESNQRAPLLIAEANLYDPEMMLPLNDGGYGFDAAWCDCFLHAVFAVVRPGDQLSGRTYRPTDLARVLDQGFVYEGTFDRQCERRELTHRVPTQPLVYSIQNHDFIGNHPLGKRLHQFTSVATQRAAAALLLLSPAIPMLFMGEEFCCEHPFQFFVDFSDASLRRGVVKGRRAEYPQHDWAHAPQPIDPQAFFSSKIGPAAEGDQATRQWYRSLIQWRKRWRDEGLLVDQFFQPESDPERGLYVLRYLDGDRQVMVAVRLSTDLQSTDACELTNVCGRLVLDSHDGSTPTNSLLPNHAKVFESR